MRVSSRTTLPPRSASWRPTGVAIVTLNRPERLNAVNGQLHHELTTFTATRRMTRRPGAWCWQARAGHSAPGRLWSELRGGRRQDPGQGAGVCGAVDRGARRCHHCVQCHHQSLHSGDLESGAAALPQPRRRDVPLEGRQRDAARLRGKAGAKLRDELRTSAVGTREVTIHTVNDRILNRSAHKRADLHRGQE